MTWRARAACRGMPTHIFYRHVKGGRGTSQAAIAHHQALAICHTCPVTTPCLNHALDHHDEHGIWGGTTPQDRQALHRLRQRRQEAM